MLKIHNQQISLRIVLLGILANLSTLVNADTLVRQVIATAGSDHTTVNGYSLGDTLGQPFISTDYSAQLLTGFLARRKQTGLQLTLDKQEVQVPEAGNETFNVSLSAKPSQDVSVTVSKLKGDPDITVQSGNNLTFQPDNWNVPQTVTVAAAEDDDTKNGTATLRVNASENIAFKEVIVTEIDDGKVKIIRLVLVNAPSSIKPGEDFELTLQFVPDKEKPADGIQVYLEFDPTKLEITGVENPGVLDFTLLNKFDNAEGYINFAAASLFNDVPTEAFPLVTLRAKVLPTAKGDEITFHFNPDKSVVSSKSEYIPQNYEDIVIALAMEEILKCKVSLQGRPNPPDSRWVTELTISTGGKQDSVTTDDSGYCELPNSLLPLPTGSNFICAKKPHALQNKVEANIPLADDEVIDFGTLIEGDTDDDNKLWLPDFDLIRQNINKCEGEPDYNANADLDADGCVTEADARLFQANFTSAEGQKQGADCKLTKKGNRLLREGHREVGTVVLSTTPIPSGLSVGDTFDLTVKVHATLEQPVDIVAAYLNFNGAGVQANHITVGSQLDFVLQNNINHAFGRVNFAAASLHNASATETFDLFTVSFTVLKEGGEKTLSFNKTEPRPTTVLFEGESVGNTEKVVFEEEIDNRNVKPASCQAYVIQDEKLNNSQLFVIDFATGNVTPLGQVCQGCDIEALDIHPTSDILYGASGNDTAFNYPQGQLYKLDGQTGERIFIGSTGFTEITSLAFDLQGVLWGWAKGSGLIQINPDTAESNLIIATNIKVGDLTWDITGMILYASEGRNLWAYDATTKKVIKACDNLPPKTEALEVLPEHILPAGLLLLGVHQADILKLYAFDPVHCEMVMSGDIPIPYDDPEGIAVPKAACTP
jgi:hypothetical protein